jgi:mannosyltransferase
MGKDIGAAPVWWRRKENLHWLLLGGILLLGAALRFHALGTKGLWGDEIAQAIWARDSIPGIFQARLPYVDGALDIYLTHYVLWLGRNEFVLRFPASFFAILSIVLLYRVGQRMFNRESGVLAAFLLALSAYHVRYSQELRTYSLLVFLSLLSTWYFLALLRRPRARTWVAWIIATDLGLYAHLSMLFILAAQVAVAELRTVAGILWIRGRRAAAGARPALPPRFGRRLLLSAAAIVLLWLPDILPAVPNVVTRLTNTEAAPSSLGAAATDFSSSGLVGRLLADLDALTNRLLNEFSGSGRNVPVFLALAGIGLLGAWVDRRRTSLLLNLLILIPPLATAPFRYTFTPRYFIVMLPSFVLMIACGGHSVAKASGWLLQRLGRRWSEAGSTVTLLVLAGWLAALSVTPLQATYHQTTQNWREAATLISARIRPGDGVACLSWATANLTFYAPSLTNVQKVTAVAQDLEEPFATHPRLWFVRDDWLLDTRQSQETWIEDHGFLTVDLGHVLVSLGRQGAPLSVEEQQEVLETAASLFPAALTSLRLGDLYFQQGRMDDAARQFQEATRLKPQWGIAHTKLGNAYRDLGQLEQAEAAYRRSISVDPKYVGAYLNLGALYAAKGQQAEALALYQAAVDAVPDSAWAHSTLGQALLDQGNQADALAHLQRAVDLEPTNVNWLLALAGAYRQLDQRENAVNTYRRVLALAPNNQRASQALQELEP